MTLDVELDDEMFICPRITVRNAPPSDEDRRIRDYVPVVEVEGVRLLTNPVIGACLTSGFGERDGRLHSGIDVQSRPAGMVRAAGDGEILEAKSRPDFGNYVLIDHGSGVFTRYAHLDSLNSEIVRGAEVSMGTPLGRMGNSADFPIPIHLHFELLTGNYDTPRESFGLTARDILSAPPAG
ncbi:MAG: M23 family metallopeptidase [Gemmatimonadota bacterium]|jgi:murein DD-endopeptidase MepM/ murein hydrolase activator NlpD